MISTMVIGVDPSDTSHQACRYGFDIARAFDAHVHLVTAFSDSQAGALAVTDERRQAEAMLAGAAALVDSTGRRVTLHALPARAPDAILQVADEVGADLIVIGNKGAQGVRRVLGSVAGAVTNGAPCSILVVKTT